jgi:hypothetical protein
MVGGPDRIRVQRPLRVSPNSPVYVDVNYDRLAAGADPSIRLSAVERVAVLHEATLSRIPVVIKGRPVGAALDHMGVEGR